MKVKYLKLHQQAYFHKKMFSHFPSEKTIVQDVKFKVVPGVGVEVSNKLDCIFIPYPNIVYAQLEPEAEKKKEEKKSSKKTS
jgi:hypothetical protein